MSLKEEQFNPLRSLHNPLYLNANLIYSEALNSIQKEHWNREIKSGTLHKLRHEGYDLVTSILTRMEVIQRLHHEENIPLHRAREIYHSILDEQKILEITGVHKHLELNDPFIDALATSNLSFKDALHLAIAKRLKIPLCTHDKKLKENYSQHEEKSRYYERVFKPEELIRPRK